MAGRGHRGRVAAAASAGARPHGGRRRGGRQPAAEPPVAAAAQLVHQLQGTWKKKCVPQGSVALATCSCVSAYGSGTQGVLRLVTHSHGAEYNMASRGYRLWSGQTSCSGPGPVKVACASGRCI